MKISRFTEEQITFVLNQAEIGTKIDEICRNIDFYDATFFQVATKVLWVKSIGAEEAQAAGRGEQQTQVHSC